MSLCCTIAIVLTNVDFPILMPKNTSSKSVKEGLRAIINTGGAPVLFVGSGLSRRYLNLEDWAGLLSRFCTTPLHPFGFYRTEAGNDLPQAASAIAADFNKHWWISEDHKEARDALKDEVKDASSPLKHTISKYIIDIDLDKINPEFHSEIESLRSARVGSIVTTNWDQFLEGIFPHFEVYKSQKEAISGRLLGVGEIYKIHGCATTPESLVLTHSDYQHFKEREAYLSAKLLLFFLERPVIFVGYSLGDENVRDILKSVTFCLDGDLRKRVGDRLLLVSWDPSIIDPVVQPKEIELSQGVRLTVNELKCSSFLDLFEVLGEAEASLDASLLRRIKDKLYDIVIDNDAGKKIKIISQDQLESNAEIEFVVGVGVQNLTKNGIVGLDRNDLIESIVFPQKDLSGYSREIIMNAIPSMRMTSTVKNVPVAKFLRSANLLDDEGNCKPEVPDRVQNLFNLERSEFEDSAYKSKKINWVGLVMTDFLAKAKKECVDKSKIPVYLTYANPSASDLKGYISENWDYLGSNAHLVSLRDKLVCILDRKEAGFWI